MYCTCIHTYFYSALCTWFCVNFVDRAVDVVAATMICVVVIVIVVVVLVVVCHRER